MEIGEKSARVMGLNDIFGSFRQVSDVIENAAECDHTFSMLMGDEVAPRREFIERNAKYAKIDT